MVNIFIVGLGGQGTIMFSKILSTALLEEGYNLVAKETTGSTHRDAPVTSEIRVGPKVRSPGIMDGEADIAVGLEPMECLRFARKYSPSATVFVNTRPVHPPFTVSRRPYPEVSEMLSVLESLTGRVVALDATRLAESVGSGSAANMVMLGVLVGSEMLKLNPGRVEGVVSRLAPKGAEKLNVDAFRTGLREAEKIFR